MEKKSLDDKTIQTIVETVTREVLLAMAEDQFEQETGELCPTRSATKDFACRPASMKLARW
jgi:hypothetical protein